MLGWFRKICRTGLIRSEHGGIGIFGLFMFVTSAVLAGVAIDYGNLVSAKTQLQATADSVAHAALYSRETKSADASKEAALAIAERNMPRARFGTVIKSSDIEFGTFNTSTGAFTVNALSRSAVRVTAARAATNSNPVSSFLLQLVGLSQWNVATQSVFTTWRPACLREGFVAEGVVDIQSNNMYFNGFCIHSNEYVSINSNNTFEPGTIVSMPDLSLIDLPNSGWQTNTGLQAALREGSYNMRLVHQIPEIIAGIQSLNRAYLPSYITGAYVVNLAARTKVSQSDLTPGFVHVVPCNGGRLTVETNLTNVAIITNCEVKFSNGVALDQVVFATTSTSSKSFNSSNGLTLGRNDNCAAGGSVRLITYGGMEVASSLNMYGSQVVAAGDIAFAANANGIKGASMVAGGRIDGTSNMNMGFCGTGMNDLYEASYFRMAL